MKRGALVLFSILVGCGGSAATAVSPQTRIITDSGSQSFTAYYEGGYTLKKCRRFTITGDGETALLGISSEKGKLTAKGCSSWSGKITLQSLSHKGNSLTVTATVAKTSPCNQTLSFVVDGGSGSLSGAAGSGTIALTCSSPKNGASYQDSWQGTLSSS